MKSLMSSAAIRLAFSRLALALLGLAASASFAQPSPGAAPLTLGGVIRETLQGNRQIQITRQQVQSAEGQLQVARSVFDPTVNLSLGEQRNLTPLSDVSQARLGRGQLRAEQLNLNASVRKQLRSGLVVQGFGELSHLRDESTLNFSSPGNAYASVGFSVDIPLGRGRGAAEVATGERIAELSRSAAELDAGHQAALSTQQAINLYWAVRASERRLDLARQIESRSQKLIAQLHRLIEKEQVPAFELNLARANMADKVSLRAGAEQDLRTTRTQLGKLLGREHTSTALLGSTADDFPPIGRAPAPSGPGTAALITQAQQQRLDLEAERLRRNSLAEAVTQASERARPDITLSLGMRQRSLASDSQRSALLQSVSGNQAGPSADITLQYRWPVGGRQAQGDILDRNAQLDRQVLRLQELDAGIGADVSDALQVLGTSAELVRSADQSVEYYRAVVAAEQRRYTLGMATLKNVLETEDRLDAALQRRITQRQDHARALTRLLFETGELVVPETSTPGGYRVALERLLGLSPVIVPPASSSP